MDTLRAIMMDMLRLITADMPRHIMAIDIVERIDRRTLITAAPGIMAAGTEAGAITGEHSSTF